MRSAWKYKYIHYSIIKKLNRKQFAMTTKQSVAQSQDTISNLTNKRKSSTGTTKNNYSDGAQIQTWSRSSTIIKELVGKIIGIHTGNKFLNVLIKDEMVGRKLGEFASTRKKAIHKNKKKET